ncbi:hypothetical protein ACJ8I8_10700 [Serratia sp. CY54717]|uniref:hypothetical protein n=1 Tax=Serratia sp. CY54717 TaxID=3383637 RepID=UPI003FA146B3
MGIKLILLIVVATLFFVLGFFFGGVDWSLAVPEQRDKVAFWAMLGGWLSGVATFAAVALSLYMAYTATQSSVEALHISLAEFQEGVPSPDDCLVRLIFKNARNVRAEIINVGIQFDKMTSYVSISPFKAGGQHIPHVLEKTGEVLEFWFYLDSAVRWWSVFEQLGEPVFSKGVFIVETTMKRYELKMTADVLASFKKRYEMSKALAI